MPCSRNVVNFNSPFLKSLEYGYPIPARWAAHTSRYFGGVPHFIHGGSSLVCQSVPRDQLLLHHAIKLVMTVVETYMYVPSDGYSSHYVCLKYTCDLQIIALKMGK